MLVERQHRDLDQIRIGMEYVRSAFLRVKNCTQSKREPNSNRQKLHGSHQLKAI